MKKVIGQDELKRRTGGGDRSIEFRLQEDMVEIVMVEILKTCILVEH